MKTLTLTLLMALLLVANPTYAYVPEKTPGGKTLRWFSLPMKVNKSNRAAPGLTATQTQAAIDAAYQTWVVVSCSNFTIANLGVVSQSSGNENDGINTNIWLSSWPSSYSSSALGITKTYYDPSSGQLIDADTVYNSNYTWGVDGGYTKIDAQSVATHEIGHQLGLDHSQTQAATMFYATGQGDTSQRSLHADDIAGICYIYPSGSAPPPECTKATDCAPNETCTANKCVPSTTTGKGYGGPCSASSDCQSGICLQSGNNTFCSVSCESSACPNGDQCVDVTGGNLTKACLPNSADRGTKNLGEPCQESLDCKTQICVSVQGIGYVCSQTCSTVQNNCPTGYKCAAATNGGLCIPTTTTPPPPPPPTKKKLGEPCASGPDCESGLCTLVAGANVCIQLCDPSQKNCPTGFACQPTSNPAQGACVQEAPSQGGFGDPCTQHGDCDSKMCIETAGSDGNLVKYCTLLCVLGGQPCVSGYTCTDAGGGKAVCARSQGGDSGGCNVPGDDAPGRRLPLSLLLLLLTAVLTVRLRRR